MPDTRPVWITREQRDWLERTLEVTERVPGAPRQTPARSILRAWDAAPSDAEEEAKTRDLYTLSSQLGLPAEGEAHVPFCTLPPDHRPGCGITASGAMHPESDAAKRYREMRR